MKNINFDSGIQEYNINGIGVLRFNPSDINVYQRFMDSVGKVEDLEKNMVSAIEALDGQDKESCAKEAIRLMAEADKDIKNILAEVFGKENDFNQILGGVNLLAVCTNGERAITNLFYALMPIFQEGIESYASQATKNAAANARLNRAQRRAHK